MVTKLADAHHRHGHVPYLHRDALFLMIQGSVAIYQIFRKHEHLGLAAPTVELYIDVPGRSVNKTALTWLNCWGKNVPQSLEKVTVGLPID